MLMNLAFEIGMHYRDRCLDGVETQGHRIIVVEFLVTFIFAEILRSGNEL